MIKSFQSGNLILDNPKFWERHFEIGNTESLFLSYL